MRRVIEELVEKRKQEQKKLSIALDELGELLDQKGLFKKKKETVKQKLTQINEALNNMVTAQDREWDAYNNNHSTTVFKSLQWKIEKMEAEYSHVKTLLSNFITLEASLQRLIDAADKKSGAAEDTSTGLKEIKKQLSVYQYSDFEQRFRGGEAEVKEKLKQYLPVFSAVDNILDMGCGRGEFLELLHEEGKKGRGIDISESMLKAAAEKGLECEKIDALQYLKQQPDASLGGIFSAQVIEHLQPEYLRDAVRQAFRALRKDAPILLETINPLSLFALSNIYFLDVTHQKPLHPEYMRYLLESSGFSEVRVIYSGDLQDEQLVEVGPDQPLAKEFNTNVDKLNKMLYFSPVYAVTGIKR